MLVPLRPRLPLLYCYQHHRLRQLRQRHLRQEPVPWRPLRRAFSSAGNAGAASPLALAHQASQADWHPGAALRHPFSFALRHGQSQSEKFKVPRKLRIISTFISPLLIAAAAAVVVVVVAVAAAADVLGVAIAHLEPRMYLKLPFASNPGTDCNFASSIDSTVSIRGLDFAESLITNVANCLKIWSWK